MESITLVADEILRSEPDPLSEIRLQGVLSNLITELELEHISEIALRRRIDCVLNLFAKEQIKDRSRLWASLVAAMDAFGEDDHYRRPEALDQFLDFRAVTLQSDAGGEAGDWWLRRRASAKIIADKFNRCSGRIGAAKKPIWLTPYTGEIERLCVKAQSLSLTAIERNALVRRCIEKLGLSHLKAGEGILAFVTRATLRELIATGSTASAHAPVGSTVIEARCHLRFRPWPRPDRSDRSLTVDPYGRTYDLDASCRSSADPPRHHGAPEATRTGMDISEFETCVYLGDVPANPFLGDQGDYVAEIGAKGSSTDLLQHLARMLT